jgi:hypothetical protein
LAGALHEVAGAIRRGDLQQARARLAREPRLREAAKSNDSVTRVASRALDNTASAVMKTSRRGKAATKMCHARKLFIEIWGRRAWKGILKRLADKYSAKDPMGTSKFLKALMAGHCK